MDSARLLPTAGLVLLLTLTANMVRKNSGFNLQTLQSRIRRNDHVALVTCNGLWNFSDFAWIKHLTQPYSHWALPNRHFHKMIDSNIYDNVKTFVIVPEHGRSVSTCLEVTFKNENSFYLVDWISHTGGGKVEASMEHATRRIYGKSLACKELDNDAHITVAPNKALISNATMASMNLYSLECTAATPTNEVRKEPGTPLKNRFLRVPCYHMAFTKQPHPCNHRGSQLILQAFNFYNTVVSATLYLNPAEINSDFCKANTDVHLDMCAVTHYGLYRTSFSPPVHYTYETFYARRGTARPASLFRIVMESKPAFYLLIAALVSAFLVLVTADILEFQFTSFASTLDILMFLLASFYATFSPIPNTRRWNLSRTLVHGVWLLAILPLSNYIRSELTSRLTWLSPPESLDSLDELYDALEAGRISLCVIAAQGVKADLERNYTNTALHTKLQSLYLNRTKGTELVTKSSADCITCASRENHICLADLISNWCPISKRKVINIVESTERLRPLFGASPIRKNYPLSRAYHNLVRRIFEAPIKKLPDVQNQPLCSNGEASEQKSRQIKEFALFFFYFFGFLGTAAVALVIEIITGRRQNQTLLSHVECLRVRQDQRLLSVFAKSLRVRRRTGRHKTPERHLPQTWATAIRDSSGNVIFIHVPMAEPLTRQRRVTAESDTWLPTAMTDGNESRQLCRAYSKAPRPQTK